MKYLIFPDKPPTRATHTNAAGAKFRIVELADAAKVSGPVQPVTDISAYTPIPAPPVNLGPVPTLTARQLRLWLLSVGITPEQIDAQIAAIPDAAAQARARVEWEYASEYKHDHPLVLQIGAALGMNQAQIDAGFRTAAAL